MEQKLKIALVGDTLGNSGVERVHAALSIFFHNAGIEVFNVILWELVTYDYRGSLHNINTRSELKKFINENQFDYIIDFRIRLSFIQEFKISRFLYPKDKVIYTVHSGFLDFYFPKSNFLSKLIYGNRNIISVSEGISKMISSRKIVQKTNCIYNPIDFETLNKFKEEYPIDASLKYILAVGRIDEIKQFDQLILAYYNSELPRNNVKLLFIGTGATEEKCKNYAAELGIADFVEFKGYLNNPFPYYKNALFTVLSSKNEGLPYVLIESLACETPVISFDCFSGPSEIINDKKNGLLVENQNFEKLTEAMNHLTFDKGLYSVCKDNALKSVDKFLLENIGKQWLDYLKSY